MSPDREGYNTAEQRTEVLEADTQVRLPLHTGYVLLGY